MPDREKVIKGLHQHCECSLFDRCGECPYYETDYDSWEESKFQCRDALLRDALALLKDQEELIDNLEQEIRDKNERLKERAQQVDTLLREQEAVEPTLIREGRNKNYNDYVCQRCDNEVVYEQNYCSECGVRFLWEGR